MKYGDFEVDKKTNKSRGIAFVKFYDKKSDFKTMKDANNLLLDDRSIQIRYSNDKKRQVKGGNNNPKREFSIFFGNLSLKSKENNIRNFLSDCDEILDITIAKNENGKMKGFAHIDFDSKEAVEKVIQKNGESLVGRELKFDNSTSKGGYDQKKGGFQKKG